MYLLSFCTEDGNPDQWQFGDLCLGDAALHVGPAQEERAALSRLIPVAGLGPPQRSWRGRRGRDFSRMVMDGWLVMARNRCIAPTPHPQTSSPVRPQRPPRTPPLRASPSSAPSSRSSRRVPGAICRPGLASLPRPEPCRAVRLCLHVPVCPQHPAGRSSGCDRLT